MERNVRASDADRDRAADRLRRNFAEGRLSPEEFDERLSGALAARTVGELDDLLADLPQDPGGYALPVPVSGAGSARRLTGRSAGRITPNTSRAVFASYVTTSLICVLIWALTGHDSSFWPIWVIGPWGIVLLGKAIRGPGVGGPLDGRNRNRNRRR